MHPSGHLNLRRSIFRVLLRASRPLPVAEITRRLVEDEGWFDDEGKLNKVVAGVLRHQITKGRVQRTRWGVYRAIPERFPKTSRWRTMNWDR